MRKILLGAVAVMALTAGVIFMPKSYAAGVTARLSSTGTTTIPIRRQVTDVSGYVNVKASYKLEAKEGNPAPVGGIQSVTNLILTGQPNANNSLTGNCNLSLGNMSFSKVGDYTFTFYESGVNDTNGYAIDSGNKYDLYFQVTNVLDDDGQPTGQLKVELANQMYSYKDNAKVPLVANFSAPAIRSYVSLTSRVKGAAADADKYFKYKVRLEGVAEGTKLSINGQDATVDYNGEQVQTIGEIVPTDGTVEAEVYLKHGQTATIGALGDAESLIGQLPIGLSYSIEKLDSEDGYSTTVDEVERSSITKNVALIGSEDFASANTTIAVNNKDASVNTGTFAATWPYMLIVAFGISGYLIARRLTRNV